MNRLPFRRRTALAGLAALLSGAGVRAERYPSRAIRIVVPSPPGGSTDQLGRLAATLLLQAWGEPVIVENKPGAGLRLGAEHVARSAADGHTLLVAAVHHSIAQALYARRSYDLTRDLSPVTVLAVVPNVLIVPTGSRARSVAEFVQQARATESRMTYGSTGPGTAHHLIGEQFNEQAGVRLEHVPYKGSAPALLDLLGGRIDAMFDTVASCLPHIQSGKLRPLAVATRMRSSVLPDVPTLDEAGLTDFDIASWFGLMLPSGTPLPIAEQIQRELARRMAAPQVRAQLTQMGAEPVLGTPAEMGRQIAAEVERFAALARRLRLQLD